MGLDIKIPIGLMFSIFGLIITIYGLATLNNPELYQKSLGININLVSGIIMLVFGGVMLALALLKKKPKPE